MTKKFITCALLALLLVGGSGVVSAQTATTSTSTQLQALLDQLKNLQAQLAALQTAQQSVSNTVSLIRSLREGMSGDDIKALQAILAADPTVYPEGLITGFYGKLTSSAVKKFQAKHGIESLGIVGPKTLKKLNEESKTHSLSAENDDEHRGREKKLCVKVPPGHLIAPGWLKKHAGEQKPIVPPCQTLPGGIEKKLGSTTPATTTPDVIAPVISSVSTNTITSGGAKVVWNTNEVSNSKVWYSTSTPVSTSTASVMSSSSFVVNHMISLSGLSANTLYYYKVESSDPSGNKSLSSEGSFTTSSVVDSIAPSISSVSTNNVASTSAHVVWSTNEAATSKVLYSTTTPVTVGSSTSMVSSGSLVTGHDLTVSGLTASTTYYFVVVSSDAVGNTATSSQSSFLTL